MVNVRPSSFLCVVLRNVHALALFILYLLSWIIWDSAFGAAKKVWSYNMDPFLHVATGVCAWLVAYWFFIGTQFPVINCSCEEIQNLFSLHAVKDTWGWVLRFVGLLLLDDCLICSFVLLEDIFGYQGCLFVCFCRTQTFVLYLVICWELNLGC